MSIKDLAICIRALDYSETSQIVTFFARETGKIGAIAKGSKRLKSAFDGPLELFSSGAIVFVPKAEDKLAVLTEFRPQPTHSRLAGNLFALHCVSLAAELLNHLTNDYDPHPGLFDSFEQFLKDTDEAQGRGDAFKETLALLILFQLSLLKEIGLQPKLSGCVNCKSRFSSDWARSYFSSSANGLICRDCEPSFSDKISLTQQAANCLGNLKLIAISQAEALREIEKILVHHFTELLHKPPRMAKYVLQS